MTTSPIRAEEFAKRVPMFSGAERTALITEALRAEDVVSWRLDYLDRKDLPILQWAIATYEDDFAVALIERGADLELRPEGYAFVRYALSRGRFSVALEILRRGPKLNAKDCSSALFAACIDVGRKPDAVLAECVALLLAGAKTNAGILPYTRNVTVARALLEAGADPNEVMETSQRYTCLHLAAECGFNEIAELLLAHGASTKVTNSAKKTPAEVALKAGHVALACRFDPSLAPRLRKELEGKRLGKRAVPEDLWALWRDALEGESELLYDLDELTLLSPTEKPDAEALGVPKKLRSRLLWWGTFADGGAVAYYLPEAASPLEGSVVVVDSEGQLHARGRNVSDFIVLTLESKQAAKEWFSRHSLAMPEDSEQACSHQPLPKWS